MLAKSILNGAIATLLILSGRHCEAGELTGFNSVYLAQKVVYSAGDQQEKTKCGIDDRSILNALRADLKRGGIPIAEKWTDTSLMVTLSLSSVHLPIARVCAISLHLSASAVANVVQNIKADRVVEIYGAGAVITYSDKDGSSILNSSVSDFTKDFANQLIADN